MNKNPNDIISAFEKKVCDTILHYGMTNRANKILVALSGGADSVSLLLSLKSLEEKLSFSLCACHLNHMIREGSAQRDEDFAEDLCRSLSIPFLSEKADIPTLCKNSRESVEECARRIRYDFFERASKHFGADRVATAHTASDNAETVIFNLTRGCGTDGMCGIPPIRERFIRPLIRVTRSEVEEYLRSCDQSYVTDETNADTDYSRNFIRHNVIPQLKALNPSIDETLLRFSDMAREEKAFINDIVKDDVQENADCKELSLLPKVIVTRYIRNLYSDATNKNGFLSSQNTEDVYYALTATSRDNAKRSIHLPLKKCAVVTQSGICITDLDEEKQKSAKASDFNIPLNCGENIINEKYAVFVAPDKNGHLPDIIKKQDIVYKLYKKVQVHSDIIYKDLFARNRSEKDVFVLGNMTRKLKKVFSENHIPESERALVPLISDNEKIICLPLFSAPCDSAKPQNDECGAVIAFYRI